MPVVILDNSGATSINDGTIKLADLHKMVTDYRQSVTVSGRVNSNTVIPKFSFYFSKLQLQDLLDSNTDTNANGIEISLAIQLPGSNVICHEVPIDTSNSMVAVVSCAHIDTLNRINDPFNSVGNMVLINGYNANAVGASDPNCCPGTHP